MYSSMRNFGIAFLVALLIFGLSAYFALGYIETLFADNNANTLPEKTDSEGFDETLHPNQSNAIKTGRSFNMVIIGTDYDPVTYNDYDQTAVNDGKLHVTRKVEATAILFIRFDKENRALRICSIPAQTSVTVDYVPMTLGQAYSYRGAEYIKSIVASYVGMSIDYLFEFDGRGFAEYTQKKLLYSNFTVPISVTTTGEKGVAPMTFTAGQTVSNETAIFTLLHHTNYSESKMGDRHTLLTDFCLQVLKKLAVTNNAQTFYSQYISGLNTDMTQQDVSELMEVISTLPLYIDAADTPTTVSIIDFYKCGEYTSDGRFIADETAVQAAFEF